MASLGALIWIVVIPNNNLTRTVWLVTPDSSSQERRSSIGKISPSNQLPCVSGEDWTSCHHLHQAIKPSHPKEVIFFCGDWRHWKNCPTVYWYYYCEFHHFQTNCPGRKINPQEQEDQQYPHGHYHSLYLQHLARSDHPSRDTVQCMYDEEMEEVRQDQ